MVNDIGCLVDHKGGPCTCGLGKLYMGGQYDPNKGEYDPRGGFISRGEAEKFLTRNPHLHRLFKELLQLHDKKNADYAGDNDVFYNFDYAAKVAGISTYKNFLALIGTKLARLEVLISRYDEAEKTGKDMPDPNNESIEDSLRDLTLYCGLLTSYWMRKNEPVLETVVNGGCQAAMDDYRREQVVRVSKETVMETIQAARGALKTLTHLLNYWE